MKGGAFLPLFIAALTPLLILALLVYSATLPSAVVWRPPVLWTDRFGNPNSAVTQIAAGNSSVYVSGYSNFTNSNSRFTSFLTRYNNDGNAAWSIVNESTFVNTNGISAGPGGVYALDGGLTDHDLSGRLLWNRTVESGVGLSAMSAVGSLVYAAGFSNHPLTNQTFTGSEFVFVREYDSSGDIVWTSEFSNSSNLLGGVQGVSASDSRVFILTGISLVAYSMNGSELWSHPLGASVNGLTITSDSTSVYVSGVVRQYEQVGFLSRYSLEGGMMWNVTINPPDGAVGTGFESLASDSSGVYGIMSSGLGNTYAMLYSPSGNQLWSFRPPNEPSGGGLIALNGNTFYLAGTESSKAILQAFSKSSSLVMFGVNPPFSFLLAGAIIAAPILGMYILRRYGRRIYKRQRLAPSSKPRDLPPD